MKYALSLTTCFVIALLLGWVGLSTVEVIAQNLSAEPVYSAWNLWRMIV